MSEKDSNRSANHGMQQVSDSDLPLISVILPVYNIRSYLPACMGSLFCQTYTNLEFLLIDDGSTDGSSDLCDRYAQEDPRVIVIHQKNGGLSVARNEGIRKARGTYITCVDPDDYVDRDYVEYLYDLIRKYGTRMSICQHRVLKQSRVIHEYGREGDGKLSARECIERMLYHDVIDTSAWAKLYEASLFREVRYPEGKVFEDIATTWKLMLQCDSIAVGYESKYSYLVREDSIVTGSFQERKLDLLEMTDQMGEGVLKVFPDLQSAVLRRRVYARFSVLNQMANTEHTRKRELIRFIRKNGRSVLRDARAPVRDKRAILLLSVSYPLYRSAWAWMKRKETASWT